ncbi:MAG: OmpA family protein [Spirochaeta sp.]|nr:OmpA family protein [Spirochaeta sp.]
MLITQETSAEERWVATVTNDGGREVGRWEWVGEAPERLVFAGLNTARERVTDGMYNYQLTATDRAGNTGGSAPAEFEIYSVDTPLRFYAQQRAFSPNGDGVLDELELASDITFPADIVEWEFSVQAARQGSDDAASRLQQIYRQSGSGASIPTSFSWDGSTDERERAPEGDYRATLQLTYRHGNVVRAATEPVALDVTPPEIAVATDFERFSPDGDRDRDSVRISQSSDVAEGWSAQITNGDGEEVRSFSWNTEVTSLEWDGTDRAGNVLPDGSYRYTVSGTDIAGNTATGESGEIRIDTRPTRLYITVNPRRFSPDGDGNLDSVDIRLITSRTDGAEDWTAEVVNAQGRVVRTFAGNTVSSRETITWDGADDRGRVVDGDYTVRFRVSYNNGARPQTETPRVSVDTTGPDLAVDLEGLPFSPDNDGLNDELGINLDADDASPISSWSFDILDRRDRPFYRFEGSGTPRSSVIWDGRSTDGDTVISAEDYPYRFTATDAVGNTSEVRGEIPIDILVIRDGDLLKIQISNINFEPNSPLLELDATSPEGRKNSSVLNRLVEVFDKYQSYEIRVEGHAVNVTQTEREEREELQPLSLARAQSVREALIERGMDADRISTVGRGGTDPIVPHTDLDDRWKNRRVEFILIR